MSSRQFVCNGIPRVCGRRNQFYFCGAGNPPGLTNGRGSLNPGGTRLPVANSGEGEDSEHAGEGPDCETSLGNCQAEVWNLDDDFWLKLRSCSCHREESAFLILLPMLEVPAPRDTDLAALVCTGSSVPQPGFSWGGSAGAGSGHR